MADILQTTFSSAFLAWKSFAFGSKFHWIFFLKFQLTINHHVLSFPIDVVLTLSIMGSGNGLVLSGKKPYQNWCWLRSHFYLTSFRHELLLHRSYSDLTKNTIFISPLRVSYGVSMVNIFQKTGGGFKNTYELLNPRALKISMLYKNHIFQCMGKIFCVEFHTKYLTHTLKDVYFIHRWKFKSSYS